MVELILVFIAVLLFDLAALRWGVDSRERFTGGNE
jgi:hypothetical protein